MVLEGEHYFSHSGGFGGSTSQFLLYVAGAWYMSCERFSHTFEFTFNLCASFRITKHEHSYQKMTSVWLLPVVTLIVASSVGGELAQALHAHSVTCALTTIA